ncbi:hypothetical protein DFH11DRAFT_1570653 [Phellopilus nigrolimitatus]|nr:hypothetical protein DFH11DRAFT_1570653 [Phellopilus nigrolimitatus]
MFSFRLAFFPCVLVSIHSSSSFHDDFILFPVLHDHAEKQSFALASAILSDLSFSQNRKVFLKILIVVGFLRISIVLLGMD